MAAFDSDSAFTHELDFRLVHNSFVTLHRNYAVLAETVGWLDSHGYRVVTVDASSWSTETDLHDALASALDFPSYYGRNLDALNECLSDVARCEYGVSPDSTGLVLVINRYDAFAHQLPEVAQAVLDIFAVQARTAALIGRRMLCLVQSDDPDIPFRPVGATPVLWNDNEWSRDKRLDAES